MNKTEFLKEYYRLGESMCDELYLFSCLKLSGFDDDNAYSLIGTLRELYLKDETNTTISTISDLLYEKIDTIDFDNQSTREILMILFN